MFCTRCGRDTQEKDTFCPSCGTPLRDVPMMPAQRRLAGHIRFLGIAWLGLSAFRLIPGLVLLIMLDSGMFSRHGAPPFLAPLLEGVAVVLLLLAGAGLIAGWGLLARQAWARMLAVALGAISLVDMPFGTALGIYTFWVLLPEGAEEEYRALATPSRAA